jgi:hypothetical protein
VPLNFLFVTVKRRASQFDVINILQVFDFSAHSKIALLSVSMAPSAVEARALEQVKMVGLVSNAFITSSLFVCQYLFNCITGSGHIVWNKLFYRG